MISHLGKKALQSSYFFTLFTVLIMKGRYISMKIEDYNFIEKIMLLAIGLMLWAIRYWYFTILAILYYIIFAYGLR